MRITKTILLLVSATLILSACKKDLKGSLTEGFLFNIDMNGFLQNQVNVQFVNANYQNSMVLPQVKVRVSGKDTELVYDINGGKDIQVADQFASIAVSPGKPLAEGSPARFTLIAEAPGFLPVQQELVVNRNDSFLTYTLEMIEIANLPAGVAMRKEGSVELLQLDATNEAIRSLLPNMIEGIHYPTSRNGSDESLHVMPLGYVRVGGSVGQPATASIQLKNGIMDPASGEVLIPGDALSIYRKDATAQRWVFVENVVLTAGAGGLKADLRITGDQEFAFARSRDNDNNRQNNCPQALTIKFSRNSDVNTLHYVTVVNADRPSRVYLSATNVEVAHNKTYTFTGRLPQTTNVKVLVYEFESASGRGRLISESSAFSSCTYNALTPLTIAVNPPTVSGNPIARFELYTICEESRLVYFHEGRIQFRRAGTRDPYKDMGLAKRTGDVPFELRGRIRGDRDPGATYTSILESDRMTNNTVYQFRVEIVGRRKKDGKIVKETYTRNRIFNLTEFSLLPPPGRPVTGSSPTINYQPYKMNRHSWFAPENACDDFGY